MRLIDADKLKELFEDLQITFEEDLARFKDEELHNPEKYKNTQRGRIEGVIDCIMDLEQAETVEAIPIEWIKEWRKHKWFSNKPIEERIVMAMGVRLMLEDWEKENEID